MIEFECAIEGCSRPVEKRLLCDVHYSEWSEPRSTAYKSGRVTRFSAGEECKIAGCGGEARCRGMCTTCYNRSRDYSASEEQLVLLANTSECWACGSRERLVVDHDRQCCPDRPACGYCIRGILCSNCNSALGLLGENVDILKSLIAYLVAGQLYKRDNYVPYLEGEEPEPEWAGTIEVGQDGSITV